VQCDVSAERQASLTRLCSGRAILSKSQIEINYARNNTTETKQNDSENNTPNNNNKSRPPMNIAEIEGIKYRMVWSCLLLVEMVSMNISCAAHFQTLATTAVSKATELLRIFNSRTSQLVLGAGAIHSSAKLKSINAKHLALVTQSLGLVIRILPHVRAALMAQLPPKQHTLLTELDKVKKDFGEHNEMVLSKFVSIIGGIVEHGLVPRIAKTDFDARAKNLPLPPPPPLKQDEATPPPPVQCCAFLDGIVTNIRKMHQILANLLPADHLQDVFVRIFVYIDQKVPSLFIAADAESSQLSLSNPGSVLESSGGGSGSKTNSMSSSQHGGGSMSSSQHGNRYKLSNSQHGGRNLSGSQHGKKLSTSQHGLAALDKITGSRHGVNANAPKFKMPQTDEGKKRMIVEMSALCYNLNQFEGVTVHSFTCIEVLERELGLQRDKKKEQVECNSNGGISADDVTKSNTVDTPTTSLPEEVEKDGKDDEKNTIDEKSKNSDQNSNVEKE